MNVYKLDCEYECLMGSAMRPDKTRIDSGMWRAKKYGDMDIAGLMSYRLCRNHLGEFFLYDEGK